MTSEEELSGNRVWEWKVFTKESSVKRSLRMGLGIKFNVGRGEVGVVRDFGTG